MKRLLCFLLLCTCLAGPVAAQQEETGAQIVTIDSKSYYVHTVAGGETVYSIARRYGLSQEDVIAANPLAAAGIKPGQTLKLPVAEPTPVDEMTRSERRKENRNFTTHTVNSGETAYGITKRYGIAVSTLIEDNPGLDPAKLSLGQTLRIRKNAVGETTGDQIKDQWEDYHEAINKVSEQYYYRFVKPGETVYSISRELGVPQNLIMRNNDLSDGLKAGSTIKIPAADIPGYLQREGIRPDSATVTPDSSSLWRGGEVTVRDKDRSGSYRVAMLLPLNSNGRNDRNYLDFYRGALLALESLRQEGIGVDMDLFDTGRSQGKILDVLDSEAVNRADIIIGPVYEDNLMPVARTAARRQIPVVSPLATLKESYGPFVYQMAPAPQTKYDKLKALIEGDKNIVVVTSANDDKEFAAEIARILPPGHNRVAFTRSSGPQQLEQAVSGERENVFIILSANQYDVDKTLATLSSIQTNRTSRSQSIAPIRVIGTSRWTRFRNIDKDLYFKLRLCYVSSYYAGQENDAVARFTSRYAEAFRELPSLYSYRGYDAVKLFVSGLAAGGNLTARLNDGRTGLLQVPYRFVGRPDGNTVNDLWPLVLYDNDYTITVR